MTEQRLRTSRRRFLTSIGATAAMLPFLRSLPGYAQAAGPSKLVLVFSPNGRIRHLWGADDTSGSLVFRQNLKPLQPLAEYVQLTEGVRNYAAPMTGGTHEGGMQSLFTGSAVASQSGGPAGFPSIDTLFMSQVTGTARPDSLYQHIVGELSSAQNAGPDNRCIFDGAGSPRDPFHSAWEVMEQYLDGAVMSMSGPTPEELARSRARTATFEALSKQMSALVPRLCAEDKQKLEQMQDALSRAGQTVNQVVCSLPTLPAKPTQVLGGPPIWAPPNDPIDFGKSSHWYRDRSRIAVDLLVAALACGVTRAGVLQYDSAASVATAAGQGDNHHNISHQQPQLYDFIERIPGTAPDYKETCLDHEEDPPSELRTRMQGSWDKLSAWENYYAEEFAYLVTQLKTFGVLDDTAVVWGSEIDAGNAHSHYNMPFVLASGANVPLKKNHVARFPVNYDNGNQQGCIQVDGVSPSHNDMLRTVLTAVGAEVTSVGSATAKDKATGATVTLNQGPLSDMLT